MESTRRHNAQAALMSLEALAASARGGFACMFSTADEYETALIAERRAQGLAHGHAGRLHAAGYGHGAAVQLAPIWRLKGLQRSRPAAFPDSKSGMDAASGIRQMP